MQPAFLFVPLAAVGLWLLLRPSPGGYGVYFGRRRAVREGALAEAAILSARWDVMEYGRRLYSLVYEVDVPGGEPFRVKGTEILDDLEVTANQIEEGARVRVRVDPRHVCAVLERVPSELDAQAYARRESDERAREKALLEGANPPPVARPVAPVGPALGTLLVGAAASEPSAPKLPAFCGSCGAPVKPAEVVRPTPTTFACHYCGASLDVG